MANNPIKYSDLVSPDSSISDLIKQLGDLNETFTTTLQGIKREANGLSNALRNVSGATSGGAATIRKAASDTDKLAKAYKDLDYAYSDTAKKIADLKVVQTEKNRVTKLEAQLNSSVAGSYNALSAQYSLNKIRINQMTEAERKDAEAKTGLITQTRQLYEQMKRLQEETGKHQLNVGNYADAGKAMANFGTSIDGAISQTQLLSTSMLALGKNGTTSLGALSALSGGVKALGASFTALLSNPAFLAVAGIAGVGAGFKAIYDYNAGIQEATRLTQEFTGKTGDDMKNFRTEVQGLADAFGKDFKEVLSTTDTLAVNMGISWDEALSVIKDGFIAGADANGTFLSQVSEYAPAFHEAGLSAQEFTAIVTQTKSGIFGEKGLAAMQQALIRLRKMTPAAQEAIDAIGLSSEEIMTGLTDGSKTTFEVIQEISARLKELPPNSQAVGEVLQEVFGRQGPKAGLEMIKSFADLKTNLGEVKEETGVLGELQEEVLQSQTELDKQIAAVFDKTGGGFETLQAKGKIFINDVLSGILKFIVNIANGIIELDNKTLIFRGLWISMKAVFKTTFSVLTNLLSGLFNILNGIGNILIGILTLSVSDIKTGWQQATVAFEKMFTNIFDDAVDTIKDTADDISKITEQIEPIKLELETQTTTTNNEIAQTTTEGATAEELERQRREREAANAKAQAAAEKAAREREKEAERQRREQEKAYQTNLKARRAYEDAVLALSEDEWQRQKQATIYQYTRQIQDLQHQLDTELNLTKEGRDAIRAQIIVAQQRLTDDYLKIERNRQIQQLQVQSETIKLRLQAVQEGSAEELQLLKQQVENERAIALLRNAQLPKSQQQSESDINAAFDTQLAGVIDTYRQGMLKVFDIQQELEASEFELLRNSEYRKTQFRLQQERARLVKILKLNETASKQLSDAEVQTIKNTIAKIDQQLGTLGGKRDLYDLVGLNLDEGQKEAIDEALSYATEAVNTYMNAYVEAANKKVEAADKEVDSAKSALDAEIEARANGYANNVLMAQKELDNAKKNQQKALKEQQKAQRAQAAVQTIEQIGNLVTATSMIWSQLGFPWAIPAIGVMWASFAAAKIKAAQVTKTQSETYGEGTVELLSGGSHQSGNDVDLGTKADGTRRRAEGGEFFAVINKRNSRKFRHEIPAVINSLNDGSFAQKYLDTYKGGRGIVLNVDGRADLRDLSADVREIKEQNKRRYYTAGGNVVEVYKNLKRTYKR